MEKLREEILLKVWQKAKEAGNKLAAIRGQEVIDFLIDLLNSDEPRIRNIAALALRDIGDNQAVEPLYKAIFRKENENNRGTLVYALQTLDCSDKLTELFDLLFYGNFEVKMGASTILDEQEFEFTREDITLILLKWDDLLIHPEKCPDYNEECKNFLKDYVDAFSEYLK